MEIITSARNRTQLNNLCGLLLSMSILLSVVIRACRVAHRHASGLILAHTAQRACGHRGSRPPQSNPFPFPYTGRNLLSRVTHPLPLDPTQIHLLSACCLLLRLRQPTLSNPTRRLPPPNLVQSATLPLSRPTAGGRPGLMHGSRGCAPRDGSQSRVFAHLLIGVSTLQIGYPASKL
jgi:hypothetical protein